MADGDTLLDKSRFMSSHIIISGTHRTDPLEISLPALCSLTLPTSLCLSLALLPSLPPCSRGCAASLLHLLHHLSSHIRVSAHCHLTSPPLSHTIHISLTFSVLISLSHSGHVPISLLSHCITLPYLSLALSLSLSLSLLSPPHLWKITGG